MSDKKLAIKAMLHGIYLTDAAFSDTFKKIDDEIEKETDVYKKQELETLKRMVCTWVDYKRVLGYDDELMYDIYNGIQAEGSTYKDVIEQMIELKR